MSGFVAADFQPLDDFPLLWRWSQPSHDVLPSGVLAEIRALAPARASELSAEAVALTERGRRVGGLTLIAADGDHADDVRSRLAALRIESKAPVIVSWDPSTAVVTHWGIFTRYWDAFCYPSSDDVTVWPVPSSVDGAGAMSAPWVLCYHHSEVFAFGYLGAGAP